MLLTFILGMLICFGLCLMISAVAAHKEYPDLCSDLFYEGSWIVIGSTAIGAITL